MVGIGAPEETDHSLLHRVSVPALLVVFWVVVSLRNRWWFTPNLDAFLTIGRRWGRQPFSGPGPDYLLSSPLGPLLARGTGQLSTLGYSRLHVLALVVGVSTLVVAVARRHGTTAAVAFAGTLALSPAMTAAMNWIGQPDVFTLPALLGVVVVRSRRALVLLGVVLGLAHPEQGAVGAVVAGCAWLSLQPVPQMAWRTALGRVAMVGLGIAASAGAIRVWLAVADVQIRSPRQAYVTGLGVDYFVEFHTRTPYWLLWSLWGPLWVLGALAASVWVRSDAPHRTPRLAAAAAGVAVGLIPLAVTLDETRVFSMVTAPLLVPIASAVAAMWRRSHGRRRVITATVATGLVMVPGLLVLGGTYPSIDLPVGTLLRFVITGRAPVNSPGWTIGPFQLVPPTLHPKSTE